MVAKFHGETLVEQGGVRRVAGGGTSASTPSAALANLGGSSSGGSSSGSLCPFPPTSTQVLSYSGTTLTGITYSQNGTTLGTATMNYTGSNLTSVVYANVSSVTIRTVTFSYDGGGNLTGQSVS